MSDERTTVFEMRARADMREFHGSAEQLITPETVSANPHRDYQQLRKAAAECESCNEMAKQLGASIKTIARWADAYDVDIPERDQAVMAHRLEEMSPNEVNGD